MDAAFSIQNRRSIKQFNYKALWPATKKEEIKSLFARLLKSRFNLPQITLI
jgi:hypothetical protein